MLTFLLTANPEQLTWPPINARNFFNVNARVSDTVSSMDGNKYVPSRSCLIFRRRHIYCISILNMICSTFPSVIYQSFRRGYNLPIKVSKIIVYSL